MPKKIVPKEEDLDITQVKKKETFVTRWFKDYCVNNTEEIKIVCDLTARSVYEQFSMYTRTDNTEIYAVIFHATFMTILDFLRKKQKSYNQFTFEIANSINIGYTNNLDENNEKVGNFTPIMEHISDAVNRNIINSEDSDDAEKTTKNCIRWKELNVKKNAEYCKEIQESALNLLKSEYHTDTRTSEAIIPIFCIFLDNIVNVLKKMFEDAQGQDVSEVSMDVLGLFTVFYSFNDEENVELIEFQPNITMKLGLKSDNVAGRE